MDTPQQQPRPPRLYWSRDGRTGSTQRSPGGDRYLITRWNNQWLIHHIPPPGYPGVAQQMERVPWTGERRSLRTAQQSCAHHAHQAAEKARALEEQRAREFAERGF